MGAYFIIYSALAQAYSIFSFLSLLGFHLCIQPSANSHPSNPFPFVCQSLIQETGSGIIRVLPSYPQIPNEIFYLGATFAKVDMSCANDLIYEKLPSITPTMNYPVAILCFCRGEPAKILVIFIMQGFIQSSLTCNPSYLLTICSSTDLTDSLSMEQTYNRTVSLRKSIDLGSGDMIQSVSRSR